MKNKLIAGIFAMFFVGILFSTSALAYRGNYEEKSPYFDEETCVMQDATFDEWYDLMSQRDRKPRVLSVVNEENYHLFVEARETAKSGDFEKASALREEIGLLNGQGMKNEFKNEFKHEAKNEFKHQNNLQLNKRMQNRLHR